MVQFHEETWAEPRVTIPENEHTQTIGTGSRLAGAGEMSNKKTNEGLLVATKISCRDDN